MCSSFDSIILKSYFIISHNFCTPMLGLDILIEDKILLDRDGYEPRRGTPAALFGISADIMSRMTAIVSRVVSPRETLRVVIPRETLHNKCFSALETIEIPFWPTKVNFFLLRYFH